MLTTKLVYKVNTLSHVVGEKGKTTFLNTLPRVFRSQVQKTPQKHFIYSYQQNLTKTYQEVWKDAYLFASALTKHGFEKGDRIGVYSYNNYQWLIVQLAAAIADLILVNINPAYQIRDLENALNQVQVKGLITNTTFKKTNYIDLIKQLCPQCETQPVHQLKAKKAPNLKSLVSIKGQHNGFDKFWQFIKKGQQNDKQIQNRIQNGKAEDPTNIQFTSGTTGFPKGATLSHINILNNAYQLGTSCSYTQKDIICVAVPLYHCFGMVIGNLGAIVRGASVCYTSQGFNAKSAMQSCQKYKCSSLYGVPTMFMQYLKQNQKKKYNLQLRTGIMAGSICPQILMKRVMSQMNMEFLSICYGMTQTSPVTFQTRPSNPLDKQTQTVGQILPRNQAKVINSSNQIIPIGQIGQLCVRGQSVMLKYWDDEQKTRQVIKEGWIHSGDLVKLNNEGYLSVQGRLKDVIIRGGQNIYPNQIQNFIRSHQNVQDAYVIATPDQKFGQETAVLIKLKSMEKGTSKMDIYKHCNKQIAHYKIPKFVKFVDNFPITVTGKVMKVKMREDFLKESAESLKQMTIR